MSQAHKDGAKKRMSRYGSKQKFSEHMSAIASQRHACMSKRAKRAMALHMVEARRTKIKHE